MILILNANVRTFNLYVESLKLHNLYFVAHTCICILLLPEQGGHNTKLTQLFLFYFLIGAYSINILYLQLNC